MGALDLKAARRKLRLGFKAQKVVISTLVGSGRNMAIGEVALAFGTPQSPARHQSLQRTTVVEPLWFSGIHAEPEAHSISSRNRRICSWGTANSATPQFKQMNSEAKTQAMGLSRPSSAGK